MKNNSTQTAIEQFSGQCWRWAVDTVADTKRDIPFTFMGLDTQCRQHVLVGGRYPEDRSTYRNLLEAYCLANDIMAYAVICSCWMVRRKIDEEMSPERRKEFMESVVPSNESDKIDALVVYGRGSEGITTWEGAQVTHPDGRVTVEETHSQFTAADDPDYEEIISRSLLHRLVSLSYADEMQKVILKALLTRERLKKYFETVHVFHRAADDSADNEPDQQRN